MVDWGGDDNYYAEWQKALEKVDFQAGQITTLRQEIAALTARIAELEAAIKIFLSGGRDSEGHHYPETYVALRSALRGKEE